MPAQFTPNGAETQASEPAAANHSATPEVGAQTSATASPPALLTPDAVRSLLREELTAFQREQQSQRDKQESRINQRIDMVKTTLAATGKTLSAEDEQKARAAISQEIANNSQAATAPPSRPAGTEAEQPTIQTPAADKPTAPNPQTAAAWAVMEGEGIDIDDADPEARMLDWTTPQTAYTSAKIAIEAKRKRIGNAALPLTGGAPNPRPAHFGMTASQTLDLAFRDLVKRS